MAERLKEGAIAGFFGPAIGLFATSIGLQLLVSYWGGPGFVVFLTTIFTGLVGVTLGPRSGRRVAIAMLLGLELMYVVIALSPISGRIAKGLARKDVSTQKADAVFVFGSSVFGNGELSDVALSRLVHGLEIMTTGQAPRLVLSELPRPYRSYSEPAQRLMTRLGIKKELLAVGPVVNSRDEAVLVAKLFQEKGWKTVVAVTSPLHSRRACASLEHEGLNVICSPAVETRYNLDHLNRAHDRLEVFGQGLHERLGAWVYKRRGWIAN
ncbi:MAG: YdcF family protein [Deltaproteobacteria bacterium]|nr:YdcF family protein [Deltaproteobacteria bacterium]